MAKITVGDGTKSNGSVDTSTSNTPMVKTTRRKPCNCGKKS